MYKTNCGVVTHIVLIAQFGIVMPGVALQRQFFFADVEFRTQPKAGKRQYKIRWKEYDKSKDQ